MKLLLLQPPIRDFYDTTIRLQPIGLAYLKAALKQHLPQIEVIIKDYHQGRGKRRIPVPPELSFLKEYYTYPDRSPFCTFHHFYHFGAGYDTIAADVFKIKPDLVGISALFTPYYQQVLDTAKAIKTHWNVPLLAGGAHVSAEPRHLLQQAEIDYVIYGEGERPLVEFLKAWSGERKFETVPNLGYKKDGRMILNQRAENFPVDDLPVPDLTDLDPRQYLYKKTPLTFIITSRGCPYRCSFCSVHQTFGRKYRRRDAESIMFEIEQRYQQGYRVLDFEDDNLTFNLAEMKALCRMLIKRFPKEEMTLTAMNGIPFFNLDRELLQLMRQAGFQDLNISLVSADPGVLNGNRRTDNLYEYSKVVHTAYDLGFRIVSYQILGLPAESLQSMIDTMIFASHLPVLLGLSPFYLTPGTPLAADYPPLSAEEMICSRSSALGYKGTGHDRDDLYTLVVAGRIVNFLKDLKFAGAEASIKSLLGRSENETGRIRSALHLLKILIEQRVLFADTAEGPKPQKKFKVNLFFDLWQKLEYITTRSQQRIILNKAHD
jgi:tRNA A37 methylthiotransferase MiaB